MKSMVRLLPPVVGLWVAMGMPWVAHANTSAAYTGDLQFSSGGISPAAEVEASLKVTRGKTTASPATLRFSLPQGFTVSRWTSTFYTGGKVNAAGVSNCAPSGGGGSASVTVSNFQLPKSGDYCLYKFRLKAPQLALMTRYSPSFGLTFSGAAMRLTREPLQINANLPEKRPERKLGTTPGVGVDWDDIAGSKGLSMMEVTMKPHVDPGPMSDVFWANQVDIGGYFGMQSTYLRDRNGKLGRLFIFSIWNGKAFKTGSPGSWCIKDYEDGPFRGCRYVHDWKPGYTYKFTLKAEGDSWFKLSVWEKETDKTFVVGSLQVDSKLHPEIAGNTLRPVGFATWVEYIEWSNPRTNCEGVARTEMTVTAEGKDAVTGKTVSFKQIPWRRASTGVCIDATDQRVDQSKDLQTAFITGAPKSTAFGNLAGPSGCLQPEYPFEDSMPSRANAAVFTDCVPKQKFDADAVIRQQWVLADDGTIRTVSDFCLTARDPLAEVRSSVIVASCIRGAKNQQWKRSGVQLASATSGACVSAQSKSFSAGNQLAATLVSCSDKAANWSSFPQASTNFGQ